MRFDDDVDAVDAVAEDSAVGFALRVSVQAPRNTAITIRGARPHRRDPMTVDRRQFTSAASSTTGTRDAAYSDFSCS